MTQTNQPAAFFDVDGTLTRERVWKGMLDYFRQRKQKRGTHLLYLCLNYPTYIFRQMGIISEVRFRTPWAANLAWYLKGYTIEECDRIWDWIIDEYLVNYWREDSVAILRRHMEAGKPVVLVSSGPYPLIQRIALELGTENAVGTHLEIRNGTYTGRSLRPICIDTFKASMAQDYLESRDIHVDLEASYAYADSTSDLGMLEMVGNPVAVYPDDGLRKEAVKRGWEIFPEGRRSSIQLRR
ncbi:MAG: HAD-IB family hydrolase [Chloroflexota bacterium]|nr:HAD-IB family hydrolase [Chloroflexota bacterium]